MKQHPTWAGRLAVMAVLAAGVGHSLAEVPRPEHPRPDLFRESWMTLNGDWQFEIDAQADGEGRGLTYGTELNSKISVPFCPESKQSADQSWSCFYTRTTGIWQPVWLEAVGSSFVESLSVVPDPDHSQVLIETAINGLDKDLSLKAEAFADGKLVGSATTTGRWQSRLVLGLKRKKLWAPGAPFLYDLRRSGNQSTTSCRLSHG